MKDIVKTLDIEFKPLTVINRDYEAMLRRGKEGEYTRIVKGISKILEEINYLKIKLQNTRLQHTKNKSTPITNSD